MLAGKVALTGGPPTWTTCPTWTTWTLLTLDDRLAGSRWSTYPTCPTWTRLTCHPESGDRLKTTVWRRNREGVEEEEEQSRAGGRRRTSKRTEEEREEEEEGEEFRRWTQNHSVKKEEEREEETERRKKDRRGRRRKGRRKHIWQWLHPSHLRPCRSFRFCQDEQGPLQLSCFQARIRWTFRTFSPVWALWNSFLFWVSYGVWLSLDPCSLPVPAAD